MPYAEAIDLVIEHPWFSAPGRLLSFRRPNTWVASFNPMACGWAGLWSKVVRRIVIEGLQYLNYALTASLRVTVFVGPERLLGHTYTFPKDLSISFS